MKNQKIFFSVVMLAVLTLGSGAAVKAMPFGQEKQLAQAEASSTAITWESRAPHAKAVLTVSTPEGDVIRREFKSGETISFSNLHEGQPLPDGQYIYELRFVPVISSEVRDALAKARAKGKDREVVRDMRRRGLLPAEDQAQSGAFQIIGGNIVMGRENESPARTDDGAPIVRRDGFNSALTPFTRSLRPVSIYGKAYAQTGVRRASLYPNLGALRTSGFDPFFDQVIADDLIVQGSACVGLDCVNNESFGFDTIRLKENNLRIKFEDTSSAAGFPTVDWQLTANDSASGGANKFSIEDITNARVPFTVIAAAPTNSVFVASTGRVGFRTSTPVLDLHMNTSDTPAVRFEQNNSGGFTAQTWDVAGNEANFFVRDVTSGSRLPFRIRPGAPTSSLDISASGDVGIGTASPSEKLHVSENGNFFTTALVSNPSNTANAATFLKVTSNTAALDMRTHADARTLSRFGVTLGGWGEVLQTAGNGLVVGTFTSIPLILGTNSLNRIHIAADGNIGLGGLTTPTNPLHHTSGARLTAAGVWTDASSRTLKTNIRSLTARQAFDTLLRLNPVTFEYKAQPGENHVGFIAEEVPELVATDDRKTLSPMDIVAVLTKVVQEQQKTIDELKEKVLQLEKGKAKAIHRKPKR
ncbi:MAG: tail fiber domain-containing protein [Acidobacteriota bacterium]